MPLFLLNLLVTVLELKAIVLVTKPICLFLFAMLRESFSFVLKNKRIPWWAWHRGDVFDYFQISPEGGNLLREAQQDFNF